MPSWFALYVKHLVCADAVTLYYFAFKGLLPIVECGIRLGSRALVKSAVVGYIAPALPCWDKLVGLSLAHADRRGCRRFRWPLGGRIPRLCSRSKTSFAVVLSVVS